MTMKRFYILFLCAMTAALAAADPKPAETAAPVAVKPAESRIPDSVLTTIYRTNPDVSAFADQEKAGNLLNRRAELVQKIQDERTRILKEDESAKKLREEIMLLNRKLASLLETKKSMIELNSQLLELDIAISRLKPAPPPEPEAKEDGDGKADKADKTVKTEKADTADKADRTVKTEKADTAGRKAGKADKE